MKGKEENIELEVEKKRRLVQSYMHKLMETSPQMYYSSTAEVAREVHLMIKEHSNRMPIEERVLFKKITVRDVEVMLSFH